MQLFTVKMIAKRIVSFFDASGAKTGERVEEIPQVYRDLPHPTALGYKANFPDNKVEIEAQHGEYAGEGRKGSSYERRERVNVPADFKHTRRAVREKIQEKIAADDLTAAQTGDMSAAINAEMKS
ncbi:hypothetical protein IVB12_15520 [Bradyrhizobium sp. 179]|uniref:hypothetical protein n=1 Tax=Bradyrhizobium sp. 179 TaxID=2782648 RepID=UPI001FFAC1C4|nr:hypothetical protein [Bradyrhizobium sp. 179]MCK1543324.1 hypothetical protein [Bradyrhizobium sp. 179]